MPPTPTQLDLINDLEAGLKVMRQDNEKITIGGLLNHANVSAATLYNVASRLRLSGQTEYVERLREVFRHANKMPICLSIDAGDSGVSLPVGAPEMACILETSFRSSVLKSSIVTRHCLRS